jgi:hypothetical protein
MFTQNKFTREERKANLRQEMDLLMSAYNQYVSNISTSSITGKVPKTSLNKAIFLNFLNTKNSYTTNKATQDSGTFLFNARTPEQFLEMAGVKKQQTNMFGQKQTFYNPDKLEAATRLFEQAKASSLVGSSNFFDFSSNASDAEVKKRYSFSKFEPYLSQELMNKYNTLGGLQRGTLKNETIETEDDEKVLFLTSPALAAQQDLKNIKQNFEQITTDINDQFTRFGQQNKKINLFQKAALSEEQMLKFLSQDIRSTYNKYDNNVEDSYVAGQYFFDRYNNINTNNLNINEYISNLPSLLRITT